ncbi:aromatase/cyclase [Kitasatospora sp. NPDC052896]|uniref:aromatase/cyclase n=1 Tax=Kitasatospora sp. NPDC052896 TaxID=3364061 RepID=UPI0037C6D8BF
MTRTQHTSHEIDVAAPADVVHAVIADAEAWPRRFAPTLHVERAELAPGAERLRIWARANGEVKHWTSRRDLDAGLRRIRFRQEVSSPPVASMAGEWRVTERPGGATLTLTHEFTAVDDDPKGIEWITEATDRNSRTELGNIKDLAERWSQLADLEFEFEDSVLVAAPLETVHDFLHDAAAWPARLPHVARLDLREEAGGIQHMAMDTRTADGSEHTTESVRICFPGADIAYKQLRTPSMMAAHTGRWSFEQTEHGVRVSSWHAVVLNPEAIPAVLGPDATTATARRFIREAAGGNSRATLGLAKRFAEERHG